MDLHATMVRRADRRPIAAVPVLVAALVAGCGTSTSTATPIAAAPTGPVRTTVPSVVATTGPRPTAPAASGAVLQLRVTNDPLPAGTYARAGFEPAITFDLDGTWRAVQLLHGFFDVQDHPGSPDVIAVQFANVEGVYGANAASLTPKDAKAAADVLARHPGLTIVETSESKIGGLAGYQATVENATDGAVRVVDVPPGPLSILPGRRLWVAFFDTPEGLLAIMVGGSIAKWQEALGAAEPVLESVTIGT